MWVTITSEDWQEISTIEEKWDSSDGRVVLMRPIGGGYWQGFAFADEVGELEPGDQVH